ncbi:MAG: hypothetical protein PHE56_14745, partial [Bacteroidales bacterium]|nr:hypothetical protein [Bacteroidales bacterium]
DDWETYTYSTYVHDNNTGVLFNTIIRPGFDAEFENQKPIWFYLNTGSNDSSKYKYYSFHNGSIGSYYNSFIYTNNNYYSKYASFHENYMFNDIGYQNVKVFYLSEDSISALISRKLYWAKHIGLIRIEDYSDSAEVSVKNLIRYNVENYEE